MDNQPHNSRSSLSKLTIVTGLATGVAIAALFGLYVRQQLEQANNRPEPSPTVIVTDAPNSFAGGNSGGGATGTGSRPAQINGSQPGSVPQNNQVTGQNPQNPGLTDPTTQLVCDVSGVCVSL